MILQENNLYLRNIIDNISFENLPAKVGNKSAYRESCVTTSRLSAQAGRWGIMIWLRLIPAVFFLCGFLRAAEFGKNQIYTKTFAWHLCDTKHFTVYYYPEIKGSIPEISRMLEKSYSEVTNFLDINLKKKPAFFFFESHPDFHSNRIAPVSWGTGGFSEPFKNRLVMPFYTSPEEMRHIIQHEFTHIASFEIFYGGFWRSLSLVRLMVYPIPLWMQEGLAEFCSDRWDGEDAGALRDIYLNGLIIPAEDMLSFDHLEGYRVYLAYKQSQKMLIFLARKFGKKKVFELIRQFPQVWEQNVAMKKVINIDTREFDSRFEKYLSEMYKEETSARNNPEVLGKKISPSFNFYRARSPLFSGDEVSYVYDGLGYDDIILYNRKSKKERRLLKNKKDYFDRVGDGRAQTGEVIVYNAWKNEKPYLVFMKNGKITSKQSVPFTEIRQIKPASGGGFLVCADLNSQSDIFFYDGEKTVNLTNDSDYEDSFTADYARHLIIYSCERNGQLDLRCLDTEQNKKTWLTDSEYSERKPVILGGELYFLSENGGFSDIYKVSLTELNFKKPLNLTFIKTGVTDYDVSEDGQIAAIIQWKGSREVFLINNPEGREVKATCKSADDIFLKRGIDITGLAAASRVLQDENENEKAVAGVESPKVEDEEKETKTAPQGDVEALNFRKYKTRWSFDLVYPLAMFVVSEGDADFYVLNYFQASDMTGRHNMNLYLQWLSSTRDLSYSTSYLYQKWKTRVGFFAQGYRETSWRSNEEKEDILTEDYMTNAAGIILERPLDRENRIEALFAREIKTDEVPEKFSMRDAALNRTRENSCAVSFINDSSIYRFMDIVRGSRANLSYATARGSFYNENIAISTSSVKGGITYDSVYFEEQFFLPVSFPDHILAFRALGLFSWGETPEFFDITRWDRVRGLITANDTVRLILGSAEYRFYLFRNIDYNLWWLIPPMYFKSLKGILFCDAGENFNRGEELRRENLHTSVGFGLRLNALLFQMYPLTISFDRAKALKEKEYETYFRLGINW